MEREIQALKKWLKTNSPAELAGKLGYRNSQVVTNWAHRGTIPHYQVKRVMEIIGNEQVFRASTKRRSN